MARPEDEGAPPGKRAEVDQRGGHGLVDVQVPWRVFLAVGAVLGVLFLIYGPTSREHAGTVMLAVASILGLWTAAFLWRHARRIAAEAERREEGVPAAEAPATYLPEASVWPFGVGLGATLALNGLLIGVWFLVPAAMVLAVSIAGFARESRHRR